MLKGPFQVSLPKSLKSLPAAGRMDAGRQGGSKESSYRVVLLAGDVERSRGMTGTRVRHDSLSSGLKRASAWL